jgi:hypothetical protein
MIPLYQCYLTDGTTTLNLIDGVTFGLTELNIEIAPRQQSELAPSGPYIPVTQPITVQVFGNSPMAAWDNVTVLMRLLSQGEDWQNDIPVTAVRLVVQTDMYAASVEAYVLGQVEPTTPFAQLGAELEQQVPNSRYVIRDVALSFLRSGAWETTVEGGISSNTVTNPGVMLATFTTRNRNYSRVRISGSDPANVYGFVRFANFATVIVTSDDAKIRLIDSASFSTPALTTNQADAANDPLGGTVKRFEASTTAVTISNAMGTWSVLQRRCGVFIAVRNNSATATFYVQASITDASGNPTSSSTPTVTIDTSTTLPRIVFLGLVTGRFDQSTPDTITVSVSASLTSAAQTLDIDYVCVVSMDDVWADRTLVYGNTTTNGGTTTVATLLIEPGSSLLRTPYPLSIVTPGNGGPRSQNPRGDSYVVATGTEIAIIVLSTNGDAKWRLQNYLAAATAQHAFTVRRSRAYLTPPGTTEP